MSQHDLQDLMERTTSMKDPDRQRRTHSDEAAITFIKSLSLREKFEMNARIREENSARRRKTLEHARDPTKPAGSPVASYVDITSEEWGQIVESKSLFERLKIYMSDTVLARVKKWIGFEGQRAENMPQTGSESPAHFDHHNSKELKRLHLVDKPSPFPTHRYQPQDLP
ncbi:hypothetical protein VNI00_011090 [Paramarasmius palmivorus]|uniref:Uncharacterized protein n=1 Tax=Paramarasmius palmivorus TaxID=297713 RepID=A0AAW0CET9_9AGAR